MPRQLRLPGSVLPAPRRSEVVRLAGWMPPEFRPCRLSLKALACSVTVSAGTASRQPIWPSTMFSSGRFQRQAGAVVLAEVGLAAGLAV